MEALTTTSAQECHVAFFFPKGLLLLLMISGWYAPNKYASVNMAPLAPQSARMRHLQPLVAPAKHINEPSHTYLHTRPWVPSDKLADASGYQLAPMVSGWYAPSKYASVNMAPLAPQSARMRHLHTLEWPAKHMGGPSHTNLHSRPWRKSK